MACDGSDGTGDSPAISADGSVYAVMSQVYSADDERTVYVALTDTLDLDELSFDKAREWNGVANFEAVGGRLMISDGEKPLITQYQVAPEASWKQLRSLSFADFPLPDNANFFYQYMLDEHHMYMPFDGSKRVVWDPTDFEILDVKEDSALEAERDGLQLEAAGNRSGIRYDGAVLMPFFYRDEDWREFSPTSPIVVYDPETHDESKIIEAPCRGLAVASQDERGNTYFSTWDYGPVQALYGKGPAACVVRLKPDLTLDEEFTTDLTEWTGGRYSINFRYIRDGWGLVDVLHHEELKADFSGEIDEDVVDEIWADAKHWKVWRVDLERGEARPFDQVEVPGLGWGALQTDGRTFVSVPYDDGARTKFYELDADGDAKEHLDVQGDATWLRVR